MYTATTTALQPGHTFRFMHHTSLVLCPHSIDLVPGGCPAGGQPSTGVSLGGLGPAPAPPARETSGWRRGDRSGSQAVPALKQLSMFQWHLLALIRTSFPPPGTTCPNCAQIFNKMPAGRVPGREGTCSCHTKALCLQPASLDTLK